MNFDEERIAVEAADDTIAWVAKKLGIVVLQAKRSDDVIATWIFEREIKDTIPTEFERQQISAISSCRRYSIAKVIKGISELSSINVAIRFIPYERQVEIIKDELGDDIEDG